MNLSLLFAKSLALLLEEVQSASDMTMVRSGLLRVRRFARSQALALEWSGGRLSVDGVRLVRPVPALQRLTHAMETHNVAQLNISAGAAPRELLKLAQLLVRPQGTDAADGSLFEELRNAALWSIQAYPVPRVIVIDPESISARVALGSRETIVAETNALQREVRAALAAGDASALATRLATLVSIENAVTSMEWRGLWTEAFDSVATPAALRVLVNALPTCGDAIGAAVATLKRAGKNGASILISELLTSESLALRRATFDVLIEMQSGTSEMVALLQDEQWFVVRNAACLIGAVGARFAEPDLIAALKHADERVRAAVVTALLQLDTTTSRSTVRAAIRDSSPEVRRRAARAYLGEQGASPHIDKLLQVLERETDLDVQLEFLYVMGKIATPDAVQNLIRLCSVEGKYRPTELRIAAAEALAAARLGAAVPLLRTMLKDPDLHARAAARHLIRSVS